MKHQEHNCIGERPTFYPTVLDAQTQLQKEGFSLLVDDATASDWPFNWQLVDARIVSSTKGYWIEYRA